jgi:hypothetical protein
MLGNTAFTPVAGSWLTGASGACEVAGRVSEQATSKLSEVAAMIAMKGAQRAKRNETEGGIAVP